jgi:hypothetical protein
MVAEMKQETSRGIKAELLDRGFARMRFSSEIDLAELRKLVASARGVGFLQAGGDVDRFVDRDF